MSIGYVGKCRIEIEDDEVAIYSYSGENWNDGGKSQRGDRELYDGSFIIYKDCLDEPEAALSPMRLMTLLAAISKLVKQNSQFIISTHSPIIMAYPGAQIFELNERGIESVNYKDTEHYRFTLHFLQNPDRVLKHLL